MKNQSRHISFDRIAIIGVGVIGGSLGLAIKKRFPSARIVGFDRKEVLRKALKKGAIDQASVDLRDAVSTADLVFLATPISAILTMLPRIARFAPTSALVTDVGSVKRSILKAASQFFPKGNFIGGHPMAGVELSGVDAAHPLLFENAVYVLSPMKSNSRRSVRKLARFLEVLGSRVVLLDPKTHDEVASAVSHEPQLTAVALTNVAGREHHSSRNYLRLAAGGFRDLTRIASSRPEIWKDILDYNSDEIDKSLGLLVRELEQYRRFLRKKGSPLAGKFHSARRIRDSIPKSMKGFLHPLAELYVFVKDKPGMMAKMTAVLAKGEINIKDIELVKVREGRGGTFRLAFESKEIAARAGVILKRAGFEIGE